MLTLKGRQDGFRLLLPDDFICSEINEKYTEILTKNHSFITKPIDFLNETIQKVEVLGFNEATIRQQQGAHGKPLIRPNREKQNDFLHTSSEVAYRSETNPLNLIDKTLNIDFRHTLGFLNYFIIFENFFWQYHRDRRYEELPGQFNVDIFDRKGIIYSRIVLSNPLLDGLDMLSLDFSQPVAQSQTFRAIFKYSNFDFQFIETENTSDI